MKLSEFKKLTNFLTLTKINILVLLTLVLVSMKVKNLIFPTFV